MIICMIHGLEKTLKDLKLKVTPTRLAILNVFSDGCKTVNAEYIFKKLKGKDINIVTIYRTLTTFKNVGILKTVDLHKDSEYYEIAGHHHHHIVCTDCGTTESFDDCDVERLSKKVLRESSKFKEINQHSFEFFGSCKSCLKG